MPKTEEPFAGYSPQSPFNPDRLKGVGEYATRGRQVRVPAAAYYVFVRGLWDKSEDFRRPCVVRPGGAR